MARGIHTPETPDSKNDEKIEVMSTLPVKEVDFSPPGRKLDPNINPDAAFDRSAVDPNKTAPIVRDATQAPVLRVGQGLATGPVLKGSPEEDVKPARTYRVEKEMGIVDRTSGGRTKLREGKEIQDKHYNIRDLQRQGVKLRDITDLDPNAPL